jgi:flagellar FliL protein
MAKSESKDDEAQVEGEAAEGGEGAGKRKLGGKKLILFVALPALLLLVGGGGAAAYFMGLFGGGGEHGEEHVAEAEAPKEAVFYELPELLVNLSSPNSRSSFLKLRVALEIDDPEAVKELEKLQPRVIDNFQVYLRELRINDLDGSAGMFRLKEELLSRVNVAVAPVKVHDVLFKEMLVQ